MANNSELNRFRILSILIHRLIILLKDENLIWAWINWVHKHLNLLNQNLNLLWQILQMQRDNQKDHRNLQQERITIIILKFLLHLYSILSRIWCILFIIRIICIREELQFCPIMIKLTVQLKNSRLAAFFQHQKVLKYLVQ